MSRPARNRWLAVALVVVAVLLGPRLPDAVLWALVGVMGVVMGLAVWLTMPFHRARSLLRAKQYDDAATELAAFELGLSEPWKRRLAGLAVGLYTHHALAAARGTLGAVRLEQGRLDDAATHLDAAIALDAQYALPWANRAVLAAMRGDAAAANDAKDKAKALGFGSKVLDAVVADKLRAK